MVPEDLDFTSERKRPAISPGVVMAMLVIAFGVIFFLDQNGYINAWGILRYWPLALIAFGISRMLRRDSPSRTGGIILVVVGFLNTGWVLGVPIWSRYWPLLIIGIGAFLLWNAISRRTEEPDPVAESAVLSEWTLFGGGNRKISSQEFERGDLLAIFGGWEIDLRPASMKTNRAVIDANCLFGGITIRVPEDWNVSVRGVGIFGGYSDSTRHPRPDEGPLTKHLIVKGTAIFGGVDVKN